jgi:enoyl-CoA hydratase/carnithine racemase
VTRRTAARGLRVRIVDGIAWLNLERAHAGNRITAALAQELYRSAAELEEDDRVVAVVVAAAGRHFCLGVENGGEWEHQVDWVEAIGRLTRPVIAVVQGDAVAEGLELALACDLRLASDRAGFALPQLQAGGLPSHGGTQRLPRIIGRTRALDLLLTGRRIDAAEAETIGLVSRAIPHRSLAHGVRAVIDTLKGKGPVALRYAKEAVSKGLDLTLDQGIRLEEDLYVLLQTTRDRREGIDAFLQRRKPVFHGT